jgi:hypothetical protein
MEKIGDEGSSHGPELGLCNWRRSLKLKHQLRHVLNPTRISVASAEDEWQDYVI